MFPWSPRLALCGAATAALIATNAQAEQAARKPAMIAMVTPDKTAGRAAQRGAPPTAWTARRDDRAAPRTDVQDLYARKAGELAYLEAHCR